MPGFFDGIQNRIRGVFSSGSAPVPGQGSGAQAPDTRAFERRIFIDKVPADRLIHDFFVENQIRTTTEEAKCRAYAVLGALEGTVRVVADLVSFVISRYISTATVRHHEHHWSALTTQCNSVILCLQVAVLSRSTIQRMLEQDASLVGRNPDAQTAPPWGNRYEGEPLTFGLGLGDWVSFQVRTPPPPPVLPTE